MADAAVTFLLDNLRQLLLHHGNLINDVSKQVEMLEKDLQLLKAILRDSTKKIRTDRAQHKLVRKIHDAVYEAEDIIDNFIIMATEYKSKKKSSVTRLFRSPQSASFRGIATQIEDIVLRVKAIYNDNFDHAILNLGDGGPAAAADDDDAQRPIIRRETVVGFDDEAEKIIGYLTKQADELEVISIIGMPGLGKTTLASKIFRNERIEYEFPTRIWVYVSQKFRMKDVYLTILKEFTQITDDMRKKFDEELALLVSNYLEWGKFLIVFDDIWTLEDWDKIKVALPRSHHHASKIIITSRKEYLGRYVSKRGHLCMLRFLTHEESWLMLQSEIFGKFDCPSELQILGRLIALQCEGLPLTIVVIGGILVQFSKYDGSRSINEWKKMSDSMLRCLGEDSRRHLESIIALSYDKLPYHLRACFLYLGTFPEDYAISVWELIRMWIAEGFIQRRDDMLSLEETGENYLEELINWNLVIVDKRRPNGRAKTCRIHGIIRYFCINEAGRENFFHEIKSTSELVEVHKYRRIYIHSDVLQFISSKPVGPRVRTFACFAKEDIVLPEEDSSAIPNSFKLLRVLDVKPVKFTKIPLDMNHLVHLRYIVLSVNASILPPFLAKLWNMQTLVVATTSRTLDIKADISKLNQLRHVKTNASTTLAKPESTSDGGKNLQSLGTISPEGCTAEVLDRAPNLKELGIRGKLALLLEGRIDYLEKLLSLEKLKLLNDVFPYPASDGRLHGLPPPYIFPPNLRSLTLSATFLGWDRDMPTLGMLENLEVLKLKNNAFVGKSWQVTERGFRRLEALHIDHTDLKIWVASTDQFPRLRRLQLHNCEYLQEIPVVLADAPNFQLLDLYKSKHAAESAKKILVAKQKINGDVFKLSIYPLDE